MESSGRYVKRFGRRAVLGGVVVGGGAVVGGGIGRGAGSCASGSPGVLECGSRGVAQSDFLVESIGINTHLGWRGTAYERQDRVLVALEDLGLRHIRDRITGSPAMRTALNAMASHGIRVQGVSGALRDPQTMTDVMAEVRASYRTPTQVFSAFEGINEPNNDGVPWAAATRLKTSDLVAARDRARLSSIPVVAPALARVNQDGIEGTTTREQSITLGDMSDLVDFGNVHVYPREQTPSADIDRFVSYERSVSGTLPIVCSEAGYFTAMAYRGGAWPTPESVVASYLPRLILEHWIRGTSRVYLYELLDRYDASNADRRSSFGLLGTPSPDPDGPWREKPAYQALKNLTAILSDPGPAHTPTALDVHVTGDKDLRSARFAKRDGSHYLALWRDVSSYDAASRTTLAVTPRDAVVKLARHCAVSVFAPTTAPSVRLKLAETREVRLSLGVDLVIARFS